MSVKKAQEKLEGTDCIKDYNDGYSIHQISSKYNASWHTVDRYIRRKGVPIRDRRIYHIGSRNPSWKGDNVSLRSLHQYVRYHKKEPEGCEICGKTGATLDLANISQHYRRDLKDWEYICRKCHMTKDGRSERLTEYCRKYVYPKRLK